MSVNNREFRLSLEKFGKVTEKQASMIVRKITLELDSSIVLSTPVDTGRARANWYPSFSEPSPAVNVNEFDKGGNAAVQRLTSFITKSPIGNTVWMTNNLHYIEKLEHGHSKQAPNGMVAMNMARIVSKYGGVVG